MANFFAFFTHGSALALIGVLRLDLPAARKLSCRYIAPWRSHEREEVVAFQSCLSIFSLCMSLLFAIKVGLFA